MLLSTSSISFRCHFQILDIDAEITTLPFSFQQVFSFRCFCFASLLLEVRESLQVTAYKQSLFRLATDFFLKLSFVLAVQLMLQQLHLEDNL